MTLSPRHEELAALSDRDLISRFNAAAENTVVGLNFYRDELVRRQLARESERMLRLTRSMRNLTWVILVLTVVNVVAVMVPLFRSSS